MTAYTAKLKTKGQTPAEYIMTCARAFGALASMRDEPLDKPVPENFDQSDYWQRSIARYEKHMAQLVSKVKTQADKVAWGKREKDKRRRSLVKMMREAAVEDERLRNARDEVSKWEPPTPGHSDVKRFALEQINLSFNNSAAFFEREMAALEAMDVETMYDDEVESAQERLIYYRRQAEESSGKTSKARQWVDALVKSLPQ